MTMIWMGLAMMLAAEPFVPMPLSNPGTWISSGDYPAQALREEQSGTVSFAVDVDATGRITSCWITFSSGSPVLDAATCQLITSRASFEPARDRRGRKVAGQYRSRVSWQIPLHPAPLKSWSQTAKAVVSGTGKLESCTAVIRGEFPDGEDDFCKMLEKAPPPMLLLFRFTPGQESMPMTAQLSFSVDGAQFPTEYRAEGFKVTNLVRAQFEIDAEGFASECKVIESEGLLAAMPDPCRAFMERQFDVESLGPDAAFPRQATMLLATSVKQDIAAR